MKNSSTNIVSTRNTLIWALLLILGSVTYLSGYYFPSTINFGSEHPIECPQQIYRDLGYKCERFNSPEGDTFALQFKDAQPENQFAALEGMLTPNQFSYLSEFTLKAEVSIYSVTIKDSGDDKYHVVDTIQRAKIIVSTFDCNHPNNHSPCKPQNFGQIVGLNTTNYLFIIKFLDLSKSEYRSIHDFKLAITSYNLKFSSYLSILKIGLFGLSVIGYAIYRAYLGKVSTELQTSEQRYVGYLGFILLLFNQPFFNYLPTQESLYLNIFGVVTVAAQGAFLFLFWFVLVERLASNDVTLSPSGKSLIKIIAFIHFFVTTGGYALQVQYQQLRPQDDLNNNTSPYVVLYRMYLYGFTALVGLWTIIRLFRILRKYKELDWRDGTTFTFSFCYVVCYILYTVSGSLQVGSFKGSRVVLLYGISTLYTLLFEVIYAPFEHEIDESEKRRKYETPATDHQIGDLDFSDSSANVGKNDKVELRRADQNAKRSDAYDDA